MDRRFIPLFIIVLIDLIGFGIIIPILPLYAEARFAAGDVQITLLIAAFSAAQFLAAPVLGRLSDAFGRRPVLILSQIGTMISFVVLGFANSLFLLYLGRVIDGISGGNISTARAYVNDITTEENRARGFGLISAAFGTGFIIGPALGGVVVRVAQHIPALAPYSQVAPFFVAATFSLGSVMATYFLLPESLPQEDRSPLGQRRVDAGEVGLTELLSIGGVRQILIFAGTAFVAFAIFQSSFPLVAERNVFSNLSTEDVQFAIALLLTWMGILIVGVQFFLVGPLVRRFGERQLVVAGALIRIPAFVGIAVARTPWVLVLSFVPLAVGNGVSFPALQSLISRFAPPTMRGRVLGVFQSTQSLSLVIGPAMAGPLLTAGTSVPPWTAAALIGVAFLISIQILSLPVPTQEQAPPERAAAPAH